ncbi:UNVERIFIED_CONTAM: putative regulator of Ras-like GTPase activity (Roadblock/LC7/MglB family) [Streptomyces canus]
MAAAQDGILEELRRLRARVPQLTGALAADADGLVLAQDTPGVDPETVAALTGATRALAAQLADQTGQGDLRELLVRGVYGYVATYAAGAGAVVTLLAQDRVNVGRLHLEGRRAVCPDRGARRQPGRRAHRSHHEGAREARSGPCQSGSHVPGQARGPARSGHRTDGGPHHHRKLRERGDTVMANTETTLKEALASIEGATGVALVDYTSGMALGTMGGSKGFDLNVAAAGNTDVVRAKMRTMEHLGLKGQIEDILITLSDQYHLIRLISGRGGNGLFLYLVLDAKRSNLAMARHQLRQIENDLEV